MTEKCRTCGKPLEQPVRGRRKVYCSIPCRRAQEVAIDRLRGRLADVQDKIDRYTSHPRRRGAITSYRSCCPSASASSQSFRC